jgi:hypothetical protein
VAGKALTGYPSDFLLWKHPQVYRQFSARCDLPAIVPIFRIEPSEKLAIMLRNIRPQNGLRLIDFDDLKMRTK